MSNHAFAAAANFLTAFSCVLMSINCACSSGVRNFALSLVGSPALVLLMLMFASSSTASLQMEKSRDFLNCSGNLSNCGTINFAHWMWLETHHVAHGAQCLRAVVLDRVYTPPQPTLRHTACKCESSSILIAIAKLTTQLPVRCLPLGDAKYMLKQPSPSVRPARYQPNSSSESASIECASLMTSLLNSAVVGGASGLQPAGSLILSGRPSQRRGAVDV